MNQKDGTVNTNILGYLFWVIFIFLLDNFNRFTFQNILLKYEDAKAKCTNFNCGLN